MAERRRRASRRAFLAGMAAALVLSAAAVAALLIGARGADRTTVADAPPAPAAVETGTPRPSAKGATAAGPSPSPQPAEAVSSPSPASGAAATPPRPDPAAPEPAAAATEQAATGAAAPAPGPEAAVVAATPAGAATGAASPPAPGRWRSVAAAFDGATPPGPRVAVLLTVRDPAGFEPAALRDLGAPVTLAVPSGAPGAEALARRADAAGFGVLTLLGPGGAAAPLLPGSLGFAFGADLSADEAAEVRRRAAALDALAVSLAPDASGATLAVAGVDGRLAYEALREGGRRAEASGATMVALDASPGALVAIARWAAVETAARPAPVAAAAERLAERAAERLAP